MAKKALLLVKAGRSIADAVSDVYGNKCRYYRLATETQKTEIRAALTEQKPKKSIQRVEFYCPANLKLAIETRAKRENISVRHLLNNAANAYLSDSI